MKSKGNGIGLTTGSSQNNVRCSTALQFLYLQNIPCFSSSPGNISLSFTVCGSNVFPFIPIPREMPSEASGQHLTLVGKNAILRTQSALTHHPTTFSQQFNAVFDRTSEVRKLQLDKKIIQALQSTHSYNNMNQVCSGLCTQNVILKHFTSDMKAVSLNFNQYFKTPQEKIQFSTKCWECYLKSKQKQPQAHAPHIMFIEIKRYQRAEKNSKGLKQRFFQIPQVTQDCASADSPTCHSTLFTRIRNQTHFQKQDMVTICRKLPFQMTLSSEQKNCSSKS